MSDIPTPETDAAAFVVEHRGINNGWNTEQVFASHARKLERQRDELQLAVQNHHGAVNIAIEALDRAITQRDEARELMRELRDALEAVMPYIVGDRIVPWKAAESALTKAKEVLP